MTIWTEAQPREPRPYDHPGPEGRKPDDSDCLADGGSDSRDGPKKKPSAKLMTGRRDKATKTNKAGDKKPGDKPKKPGEKKARPKK